MGKVKRLKQKLHNAAQRTKEKEAKNKNVSSGDQEMMDSSDLMPPPPPVDPTAVGARGDTLFKDVKIGSDLLTQKLPDFDAQSTVTSKTFKGLNLTKKEKQKFRHDAWMAKIDHLKTAEKQAKEKKKKAKKARRAPIVGDLTSMVDALPTLELLMKKTPKEHEREEPKKFRSTQPEKKRKAQMLKDISLFKQVLQHPLFVENEQRTITDHIKIAIEKGAT